MSNLVCPNCNIVNRAVTDRVAQAVCGRCGVPLAPKEVTTSEPVGAKGWVYVISNKAMPGIVKVGFTMKEPRERAAELNHTGAPHPYRVDYHVSVEDPYEIEQSAHRQLSRHRVKKEWFRCSSEKAVAAIVTVIGSRAKDENFIRADRERTHQILKAAEAENFSRKLMEKKRIESDLLYYNNSEIIRKKFSPILNEMLPNGYGVLITVFVVIAIPLICIVDSAKEVIGILFITSFISVLISIPLFNFMKERAKKTEKYKEIETDYNAELNKARLEADIIFRS